VSDPNIYVRSLMTGVLKWNGFSSRFLVPKPRLGNALCRGSPGFPWRETARSRGFGRRRVPKQGLGNEDEEIVLQ